EAVRAILADVRSRGDEAGLHYTRKFDRVAARSLAELEVPREKLQRALESLSREQAGALREAGERIRDFHRRQLQSSWDYTDQDGTRLGQRVTAIDRVGIYVPGGKAAYPSYVLMNALPAKVAGVRELVMVSPAPKPLVLAAAALAEVDRVIGIGGAQALGALAYGARSAHRDARPRGGVRACQPHRARASRAVGGGPAGLAAKAETRGRHFPRPLELRVDRRLLRGAEPRPAHRRQRALLLAARRLRFPEALQRHRRVAGRGGQARQAGRGP